MLVGVAKEIKSGEARVGLTPGAVGEYVAHGHRVLVETKAGAGIEEDYPAEADDLAGAFGIAVSNRIDDVLADEGRRHGAQVVLDLATTQLGMIRVVGLLTKVEVDKKGPDMGVIPRRELLHTQRLHRSRW